MTTQNAREQHRIILAHGEVTGHCHEVVAVETGLPPGMDAAQFFEDPSTQARTLIVLEPCALRHDEHAPIALSPSSTSDYRQGDVYLRSIGAGTWRVIRQREGYQPDQWRQVAD